MSSTNGLPAFVFAALLLGGCSGSPASVSGSVSGYTLKAADAVSIINYPATTYTNSTVNAAVISISNAAGSCNALGAHTQAPNFASLAIAVVADGGSVAPGTYGIATEVLPGRAMASLNESDSHCVPADVPNANATGGAVTLTRVDAVTVDGTFQLSFGATDQLSGSFSALNCPALVSALTPDAGTVECGG